MAPTIYGICEECRKRIPATHVVRDGKVYISKQCPDCGTTEALVSNDAATWQRKRDLWNYDPESIGECRINCRKCSHPQKPRLVFMDVTNRCNMNCPICIANIPGMGFEFNPPMAYFEKIIGEMAHWDPKPTVLLFGGEPTVRKDMFEIIDLCRSNGLHARVVTNGLKMADEEYCKKISRVPVLFGFDGLSAEIYDRLRRNPGAYYKKVKALENLKKFSTRKNTIMVCVARNINDTKMGELIEFIHGSRDVFEACHLIPLTETWDEGEFETDVHTTIEDVERIIREAMPDEEVEFLPIGLAYRFNTISKFFGAPRWTFGGVHPNCETTTVFFSDGERYHALSHYLTGPLEEVAADLLAREAAIRPKLEKLDHTRWLPRWRGRLLVVRTFLRPVLKAIRLDRILKGSRVLAPLRMLGAKLLGRKGRDIRRKYTNIQAPLRMIVLPFEEYHSIDGARLQNCTAGFVYEDPETGKVKHMPVCAWSLYRMEILRGIADKYAKAEAVEA